VKVLAVIAAALGLCVGLTACGGNKQTQQEAEQSLCTSLDNFAASVVALQGLALGSSSEDDVKAAVSRVDDSWDAVLQDAKDVKNISTDDIRSSYEDLKSALENRPTDEPISQVIAGLEPQVQAFAKSFRQLLNGLDCKEKS
jgi:hypothetical protein